MGDRSLGSTAISGALPAPLAMPPGPRFHPGFGCMRGAEAQRFPSVNHFFWVRTFGCAVRRYAPCDAQQPDPPAKGPCPMLQIEMLPVARPISNNRNTHIQQTQSNPQANTPSSIAFEHQFGQHDLPFIATEAMVVILVPVLLAPAQDGGNLAAQERRPFGRGEGAGKTG